MKKLFTILAVAVMVLLAGKATAQITLHAGYQNASYEMKYGSYSSNVNLGGFYGGATYDIDLGMASIYVTPGAELSYCSFKQDVYTYDDETDTETKNQVTLDQIDLRLRLWARWNKNLTEEMVFGIFAGPAINVGLSGKVYDDNYGGLKKVDLGLTFGAQLRYNKVGFEIGYNLGLLDRAPSEYGGDGSIKFKTLLVGLNFII